MMKLTYIYHSGFVIESDTCNVCFDFFKDTEARTKGYIHDYILEQKKKLYVLSSHAHPDHFNKEILNWKNVHSDIQYILSKDILDAGKANANDAVFLEQNEFYEDLLIKIKAYGSTDIGVSFLVELDGKKIFHAGDLNNWHWNEEVPKEESNAYEQAYLTELNSIAKNYPHLDLVIFPVDIRLGKDYMLGAQQFIDRISVDVFAPMHFGKNYEAAAAFREYASKKGVTFIEWKHKGQSVQF